MSNYNSNRPQGRENRGGYRGSNSDYKPRRENYNDRGSEEREMFPAVCDDCGRRFDLPFKPRGDKPVYCNDCFRKRGDDMNDRPKKFDDRVVAKHYGSELARQDKGADNNVTANIIQDKILGQLISLNAKFDKLIKALEGGTSKEDIMEQVEEIVPVVKKEKKAKKAKK